MITRLIKKGIVERIEPGYVCHALVDEETYRKSESKNVVNKLFSGSFGLFARAFMDKNKLTNEDIEELKKKYPDAVMASSETVPGMPVDTKNTQPSLLVRVKGKIPVIKNPVDNI